MRELIEKMEELSEGKKINSRAVKAALKKAGVEPKYVSRNGLNMEMEIEGKDEKKTFSVLRKQFGQHDGEAIGWGGFQTGYGGWVIRPNYKSPSRENVR